MGARLYVLGVVAPGSAPWVLALDGYTLEGARRAIRATPALVGTLEALEQYWAALAAAKAHFDATGRRCPVDLVPALVGLEGRRVEVVDRYGETRRFTVGKSTGWIPCHLEISSSRSHGGCPAFGAPFSRVTVIR